MVVRKTRSPDYKKNKNNIIMKNHFLISDSEKSRILNLHESRKDHHGTSLLNEDESKESYKKGDKLVLYFDRKVLGIELTSGLRMHEPGLYSWSLKVTNAYTPELENKTGTLERTGSMVEGGIDDYTVYVYDKPGDDEELLYKVLKPNQVKKR